MEKQIKIALAGNPNCIVAGGTVTVISTIGGNVIVKVKEARIAISKEMASKIMV